MRLILLSLFIALSLFGNDFKAPDENQSIVEAPLPKVLYLSLKDVPERIIKGEIFSITLKTLSTVKKFQNITYKFANQKGLKSINKVPYRENVKKYYYDTFFFLATRSKAKLPDITATLVTRNNQKYKKTTLIGEKINTVTLNPKKEFSNIIADSFKLVNYKTTNYDKTHNIIVFSATAQNCNIKAFKLKNVYKQGIESLKKSIKTSKITYYAVINKEIENFSFSYFNLQRNKYLNITIPIIVNDDSVTTQTDLKPKNQSKEKLKMSIAGAVALVGFVIILWRRKYIYLPLIVIPLAYIAYMAIPAKDVCIKQGSMIYLLPVHNGTIFETTSSEMIFTKEGSVKEFVKVKLKNEKIGWVKNENICSN